MKTVFQKISKIPIEDIPANVVSEKFSPKISKLKTYNMAMGTNGNPGVYVWVTSCSECNNCLKRELLKCTQEKNGKWYHHKVVKSAKNTCKKAMLMQKCRTKNRSLRNSSFNLIFLLPIQNRSKSSITEKK